MGSAISIQLPGDTIITRCWDCVAGEAAFVCKIKENLEALQIELTELKDLRNDVMRKVRFAEEQQQLQRLHQVDGWLTRAESLITDADRLISESDQEINNLCMGGCCSRHPWSSHKFRREIARKLREVRDQKNKGVFTEVAEKVVLVPPVTELPSEPIVGLNSTFNQVWRCLQEGQVGIIGLYGLGGVGKTTLLKRINNRFCYTPRDYHVIWVVASQDMSIEKVQEEIGKRIGFSDEAWKQKSVDEKAKDIFRVLCKKKFVLLLDDIWKRIELKTVGVPLPTPENGSKLIFTTRSFDVCSKMGKCKNIEVKCLPQREALELFEKNVGAETLASHAEIRKLAEVVAKECAGLPLALVTIGRAMASKRTPEAWKHVIDRLRQSAASIFPEEVGKEMYATLKYSYDCLPGDMVRSCFLYCSLYPEDFLIPKRDLIDCWIGEGFLDEHTNLSSVQDQGHYIIDSLVNACLLEKEEDDCVKMHDVIRDMALWIAGEKFFVKAGVQLRTQPVAETWENIRRVSLMRNQIQNLTELPPCLNLRTLFLGWNQLKEISNDFFNSMPMLRVLDLSKNSGLKSLSLAKLVSIEHLNLSWTGIREFPDELKALQTLKYLNLEFTNGLVTIPQQLISSFSKLQVLRMLHCGCEWYVEEIEELKDLEVLTISFQSVLMLERALASSKFQTCNVEAVVLKKFIVPTLNILGLAKLKHLRSFEIWECKKLNEVKIEGAGIASAGCFQSLRTVKLISCTRLRDVSWVIFAPLLETLVIFECLNLEEIVSSEKFDGVGWLKRNSNLFSKLKTFDLSCLSKLKTIYRDALLFPELKRISINECPILKKLPLNSNSANEHKIVIEGNVNWWKKLEWEDEATRIAFFASFKRLN